jgi:hypothetical protein
LLKEGYISREIPVNIIRTSRIVDRCFFMNNETLSPLYVKLNRYAFSGASGGSSAVPGKYRADVQIRPSPSSGRVFQKWYFKNSYIKLSFRRPARSRRCN